MAMKRWKQLWLAILTALITLFLISSKQAQAEIKNGYNPNTSSTIESLEALYQFLLDKDLTKVQRNSVKAAIKSIETNINV